MHGGLALASSLSALGNMGLLLFFLRKKIGRFGGKAITVAGAKAAVASLPMALAVYWVMGFLDWSLPGHKLAKASVMTGAVGAGVLLFLVCAHLLRSEEAGEAVALFRRKVLKR